jgi:hypothetical protein
MITIICGRAGSVYAITTRQQGHAMRRRILLAFASAAIGIGGGLALAQHHGHHDHKGHGDRAADTRVLVAFPPELAEHTLANMRDHLQALQEINDSLARGQNDKAAKIAEERLGMTSLRLHGAHEVAKYMPQGMQDAGTAMHRAASRFAIEAQNSAVTDDLKPALAVLGEVMAACVGCHAGYRLK